MDRIAKALAKLIPKEREWVRQILRQLERRDFQGLNVKKLKDREDIFRVRKGDIRIIYRVGRDNAILILRIDRKREGTYKF